MNIVHIVRSSSILARRHVLCRGCVQRLELDIVLAKQAFVVPKTFQQLSLGVSTAPLARGECGRHALYAGPSAVGAGEFALAFDLALLT